MKYVKAFGRLKKNQKGFTLVELIVTLAIFSIVMVVAGNYLFFGNNLYTKTEVKNTEKYIGDNAFEYLQKRLTYAIKLKVVGPKGSIDEKCPSIVKIGSNEHLLMGDAKNPSDIFGDDFYGGKHKVSYVVKVLDQNLLDLKINVIQRESGEIVYSTGKIIKLLSLTDGEKLEVIGGQSEDSYTDPILCYDDGKKNVLTTFDPFIVKERMQETFRKLMEGTLSDKEAKAFETITGVSSKVLAHSLSNDIIAAYVSQFYYGEEPFKKIVKPSEVYDMWPDLPKFEPEVIKNVDAKVEKIFTDNKVGKEPQTFSAYLNTFDKIKIRSFIAINSNAAINDDKRSTCFTYASHKQSVPWSSRLIYSDEPGKSGWYYLAILNKGLNSSNWVSLNDAVDLSNRIWKDSDGVGKPTVGAHKLSVYEEIMNIDEVGKKAEGLWVKVE